MAVQTDGSGNAAIVVGRLVDHLPAFHGRALRHGTALFPFELFGGIFPRGPGPRGPQPAHHVLELEPHLPRQQADFAL